MVPVTQQFLPLIGSWLTARVPASLQRKAPIYSSWVRLGIATRESGAAVLERQEERERVSELVWGGADSPFIVIQNDLS